MQGKPGLSASTQAKSTREECPFLVTSTLDLRQKSRQGAEPPGWDVLRRPTHKPRSQSRPRGPLTAVSGDHWLVSQLEEFSRTKQRWEKGDVVAIGSTIRSSKTRFLLKWEKDYGSQQIANSAWGTLESPSLGITAGVAGSMVWSPAHGSNTGGFTPTPKASDTLLEDQPLLSEIEPLNETLCVKNRD